MFFPQEKKVLTMTVEYLTSPDFITRAIVCLLFITAYTYCVTRP